MKLSRLLTTSALGLVLASASTFASDTTFKIDPAQSKIEFKVRHFLGTAKGKFTRFAGTIKMDRERVEESSVFVIIQAASIDTGIAKRDEHLRAEDFFNVKKFPEITFNSRQVKRTGPNTGEIVGDFAMHGVTQSITLRAQLIGSPDSVQKERAIRWRVTTGPIQRSEYGLVWSKNVEAISMISDEVKVEMEIVATR